MSLPEDTDEKRPRGLLGWIPDWAFRVGGGLGFGAYAIWRAGGYHRYDGTSHVLFFLETGIFFLITLAYVTRRAPKERASGAWETLLPLLGAVAPFGLLLTPAGGDGKLEGAALGLLLGGTTLTVTSYAFLRRSFAILVEARAPVLRGPYRLIRHPVYLGQIVAGAGVLVWRFSTKGCVIYAVFVAIQVTRARLEERKLARSFPEYAAHQARTWRFIPFVY